MKTMLIICLLFGASLLNAQKAQPIAAKAPVPRIYVDKLHFTTYPYSEWDNIVRSKLMSSLAKECGVNCAVVEDVAPTGENGSDMAEDVLTGALMIQQLENGR